MTKRPEPLCFLVVDTEYVGHWTLPGNQCFAFAATAFRPLRLGDSALDEETRSKALVESHIFYPKLEGTPNKRTWDWWHDKERVELFDQLIALAQDKDKEIERFRELFQRLKTQFRRVEVCAWPATVDQPVIDKLWYGRWPDTDPRADWVIGWKCIRTLYMLDEDVYRDVLENLQSHFGKKHEPQGDTQWSGYLLLHILANPPHLEIVNLKARKTGEGEAGKEWFKKQHYMFQNRLNQIK